MDGEELVKKPIYVICYEVHKPRLISPDFFFLYGGGIKYRHLDKTDGVIMYRTLLPDVSVKVFDIVYDAFKLQREVTLHCNTFSIGFCNNHIAETENKGRNKVHKYHHFINTNNEQYYAMATDDEILYRFFEIHDINKMPGIIRNDIFRFVDKYNIELPRFLTQGMLFYNEEYDLYRNITFQIFSKNIYTEHKPYKLHMTKTINWTQQSFDTKAAFHEIKKIDKLDHNEYYLCGNSTYEERELPNPEFNIKSNMSTAFIRDHLFYQLDCIPKYIYNITVDSIIPEKNIRVLKIYTIL